MRALLAIAVAVFGVGVFGLLARRTALFQLVALEVMALGAGLACVAADALHPGGDGQALFLLVTVISAAEIAIGLMLFLRLRRVVGSSDADRFGPGRGEAP